MIEIYPKYKKVQEGKEGVFLEVFAKKASSKVIPFGCGRSAIHYGLKAFGLNRRDEILVSPYLSHCVLSALSRASFPALKPCVDTKAIMVLHQFGFPQKMEIFAEARKKGWMCVNNCVQNLHGGESLTWGDMTIVSFSKFFPSGLGGGLLVRDDQKLRQILDSIESLYHLHQDYSSQALETLIQIQQGSFKEKTELEVDRLYGLLPDLTAIPQKSWNGLPSDLVSLEHDRRHRNFLWRQVKKHFPDKVPQDMPEDLAPFAVPIGGEPDYLHEVSQRVKHELKVNTEVLHFDFACHMLKPKYKPALVIGCHQEWTQDIVEQICFLLKAVKV